MVCDVGGEFVQAGQRCMKPGNTMVLGPTQPATQLVGGVPVEQRLDRQRQQAGSGRLGVAVTHEGPTRTLKIWDLGHSERMPKRKPSLSGRGESLGIDLGLIIGGIGFSFVNSHLEELLYCSLSVLQLTCVRKNAQYSMSGYVLSIQADNQLMAAERWPLLHIKPKYEENSEQVEDPALSFKMEWTPMATYDSFEHFSLTVGKVSLQLEEVLLWKLVDFLGLGATSNNSSLMSPLLDWAEGPNLTLERPDPMKTRRCYFGQLLLSCPRLYLSVLAVPSAALPPDLLLIKQQWNVPLVRFESAPVSLPPFRQCYYFETLDFLMDALQKHYSLALKNQAVKILGTVDFLGNPMGLFQDVGMGLKELVIEANLGGFVSGVGYGVTNAMAKVTSSLSEGVGKIARDEAYSQMREPVRHSQYQSGAGALSHVFTGVKGLGMGLFGGATSLFTQPVQGFHKEGVEGFVIGAVKGAANTVTRPVQGVLDLATGVATAAKEVMSGATPQQSRFPSHRLRWPRVTRSLHGGLPVFSDSLANAQRLLQNISVKAGSEICLSCISASLSKSLEALICTDNTYFVRESEGESLVVSRVSYTRLEAISVVDSDSQPSLKIYERQQGRHESRDPAPKLIRCDSKDIAEMICKKILFAKQQHDDLRRSLPLPEDFNPHVTPI